MLCFITLVLWYFGVFTPHCLASFLLWAEVCVKLVVKDNVSLACHRDKSYDTKSHRSNPNGSL